MSRQQEHPDAGELQRLLDDRLGAEAEQVLAVHLDGCRDCQRRLEALAGGTLLRASCRDSSGRPAPAEALRQAIGALKGAAPTRDWGGPADSAAEVRLLDFLAAPADPGHLGRLGPYEVTEVIGRGGMGVVLKAFDPGLHRFVAIKVLAPHLAANATARKRFAREGRAAAAVNHEHVVGIHGVEEANGIPYLVMEYVSGISLQERLDRTGPLHLLEILRIGMQVAAGLAAAHAQGLVHRDIKPANILLESGVERVKITDFGLARAADDARLTQSGTLAGTPQYMAPEQARGEPLDQRADLFSLGSVLYALCTGRPPFRGETPLVVLRRICEDRPRPVQEVNADVPRWLADLIAVLHAKAPAERFQSAAEVAELLRRYLAHVQQPGRVPRPCGFALRRLWCAARRKPLRRWLGAALLLVLAGGVFGVLHATGITGALAGRLGTSLSAARAPDTRDSAGHVRLRADHEEFEGPVLGVAFAPGGEVLATAGDDQSVRLWDAATNRQRRRLEGHQGRVWSVAFSPDGKLLASAGGDWQQNVVGPGEVCLWDATTGKRLADLKGEGLSSLVFAVAFAPDGRTLATAGWDRTVRLWDVPAGKERKVLRGHTGPVRALAFSPDGQTLASAGFDGTTRLWDAHSGRERAAYPAPGYHINSVAFAPDGRTLAAAENPWSEVAGEQKEKDPGRVTLRDLHTGTVRAVLQGARGRVLAVAFSPDGKRLVSVGGAWKNFGEVILWDPVTGEERLRLHGHKEWVECVTFSPDGRILATGGGTTGSPGDLKLWDVGSETGTAPASGQQDPAQPGSFTLPPPAAPAPKPVRVEAN